MRNLISFLVLVVFSVCVHSETIEIEDSGIVFDAPNGFTAVPQEIIDLKWTSKNAPRFAIGNERASTTIAYDIKPNDLSNADLDEVRGAFETTFNRIIPGIEWKQNKVIDLNGKQWIFLEMTSNAIDTDIYNIMLITDFGNEMLLFNFNSTKEDFPKYESALRESMASIKLPKKS